MSAHEGKNKKSKKGNKRNKKKKSQNNTNTKKRLRNSKSVRLAGATVFPVDTDTDFNSEHHPLAYSLRTRGYRGRHRCGVTLLSGDNHLYRYI